MTLPFSANQQLAGAPVDVIQLDRDDLWRAQAKARHQQQHGIVAGTPPRIGAHRGQNGLDLIRRQITREPRAPRFVCPGDAEREVRGRKALCEQILEEATQMRGRRLVAERALAREKVLHERHDIPGVQRRQIEHNIRRSDD